MVRGSITLNPLNFSHHSGLPIFIFIPFLLYSEFLLLSLNFSLQLLTDLAVSFSDLFAPLVPLDDHLRPRALPLEPIDRVAVMHSTQLIRVQNFMCKVNALHRFITFAPILDLMQFVQVSDHFGIILLSLLKIFEHQWRFVL